MKNKYFKTRQKIKLYLLKITQNNDLKDIMNGDLAKLFKEYALGIMPPVSLEEINKYMVTLVFDTKEERDILADKIQHIAFEYEDIDYPIEVYEQIKNSGVRSKNES